MLFLVIAKHFVIFLSHRSESNRHQVVPNHLGSPLPHYAIVFKCKDNQKFLSTKLFLHFLHKKTPESFCCFGGVEYIFRLTQGACIYSYLRDSGYPKSLPLMATASTAQKFNEPLSADTMELCRNDIIKITRLLIKYLFKSKKSIFC